MEAVPWDLQLAAQVGRGHCLIGQILFASDSLLGAKGGRVDDIRVEGSRADEPNWRIRILCRQR